jgi:hypothetical protein
MKKMIALILLSGAFLGGYELGRKPDSPDLIGWLGRACARVVTTGRDAYRAVESFDSDQPTSARGESPEPVSPRRDFFSIDVNSDGR